MTLFSLRGRRMRPSQMSKAVFDITTRGTICMTDRLVDGGAGAPGAFGRDRGVSVGVAVAGRRALLRPVLLLLVVVVVVGVFLGGVGSAGAAMLPGYGPIGSPIPDSPANHAVAVDSATGNLLAADPDNNRVLVFAPDLNPGGTGTFLTLFDAVGPVGGIAVDQTSHAVYVSENGQIERFVTDGAPTPAYTSDPTFVNPVSPNYAGGPIAVDPTTHDLLVGQVDHVDRYSSAGLFLATFDGSGSPGAKFTAVRSIAVGATSTYVLNLVGDYIGQNAASHGSAVSRIVQVDGQGVYERTIAATHTPVEIAVDGHDRLVAVQRADAVDAGAQLATYDDGVLGTVGQVPGREHYIGGVAIDGGTSGRAYVSSAESPFFADDISGVGVLGPGPAARIDSPASPGSSTVHVTGTVNPEGSDTTAHFEYCSLRDPCATDTLVAWQQGADIAVGSGSSDVAVASDLAGLLPHTGYRARLVAVDTQGSPISVRSPEVSFVMQEAGPLVTTGSVSDLSASTAVLTGTVTPLGLQSTYYFEYGGSASYGMRVPAGAEVGIAGTGFAARSASQRVSGLKPGTAYHYRLVGVNSAGSTEGADRTLITKAAAGSGDSRVYEMVSPVDKQDVGVSNIINGFQASASGDSLLYTMDKQPLPGAQGALFTPRALAVRSATGWSSTPLDLPLDNLSVTGGTLAYGTVAVSTDVRRALVLSRAKLTDAAVDGGWNLYIRDPGAQPPTPEFVLVATDPRVGILAGLLASFRLVGVSDDLRTIAFTDNGTAMYEAVVGQGVRRVSLLPDGTPTPVSDPAPSVIDAHQVSTDGKRIYFVARGGGNGALYLRENDSTKLISVSQRPGDPQTPQGALFVGASPDGRYVEFATSCKCTTDAPDGGGVYRYDADAGKLNYLAEPTGFAGTPYVARPEANTLFYGLSYAHDGVTKEISDVPGASAGRMRASENGRYVVFTSASKLTSYDNTGHTQIYRYDTETADLSCVSCPPGDSPATSDVALALTASDETAFARYNSRVILDDGTVFFDTDDPLVGADINGTSDVYEYRDGRAELISRGLLPTRTKFVEVTPDGSNVFFTTTDRLVAQDRDSTLDVYDARIGSPPALATPPKVPCAGDECRPIGSGPVSSDPSPSQQAGQSASKPATAPKARISVVSSSVGATTLRLVVQVNDRGRIRVSGVGVRTLVRTAAKAGKYTLKIGLGAKTRSARRAHRKVKVAVKVTLTPPFASATTVKFSRTLGR